jgi:predicted acyl esterase
MESAATQSKKQKKNRYQPKTTGAIKWGDKRDKKRDVKNGNKDNFNYEKTVYTYDSPKFTEYYKVSTTHRVKECLDLVC